ncbi:hypothetical protein POTOM_011607 [Populus tomentosa]|uniref:EGF-like domain-containing protein n=1 Tax=Populus tomentosa TaxID=118781 RepID=A0A8X8A3U2_POPTO|nr:hypothetical protein POTOM_011607 [Populus tomentosa]
MNTFKLNFTPISFHLLLFSLLALTGNGTLQDDVCALINCGEGACKASNASVLGFDCECYSGWKKIQIGPLTFPSCIVPNYIRSVLQPVTLFGVVMERAWLMEQDTYANAPKILQICYLGADCTDLVLGKSPPSPPPPAPTSSATSILNGLLEASNSFKHLCALSMILLAAAFQTWL